jgi:hypothetical protein
MPVCGAQAPDGNAKMTRTISRRSLLLNLGGLTALGLQACATQSLSPGRNSEVRFKAIRVDVSPLVNNGNGPYAEWISQDLPGLLQTALAAHLAPKDPAANILLVRIDLVVLGSIVWDRWMFSGPIDSIQGTAMILSPAGKTIATYTLLSSGPTTILTRQLESIVITRIRVTKLAESLAWWLPQEIGL